MVSTDQPSLCVDQCTSKSPTQSTNESLVHSIVQYTANTTCTSSNAPTSPQSSSPKSQSSSQCKLNISKLLCMFLLLMCLFVLQPSDQPVRHPQPCLYLDGVHGWAKLMIIKVHFVLCLWWLVGNGWWQCMSQSQVTVCLAWMTLVLVMSSSCDIAVDCNFVNLVVSKCT